MSEVATLYFTWEQVGPLHSGYGQTLAQALGKIAKGARKSAQLETHVGATGSPAPAFLSSSVKGVFRSASAWLVERTRQRKQWVLLGGTVVRITLLLMALVPLLSQNNAAVVLLVILLGVGAYTGLGTLLAALSIQTRTRDVLLPILLYPLALPILIAAVEASRGLLAGQSFGDLQSWIYLLLACNILFSAAGLLFFETILEE